RITIVETPPVKEISKLLGDGVRELLIELREQLYRLQEWNEEEIKKTMMNIKKTPQQEKQFFKALYLAFFGKEYGPRLAPYLAMLNKDFVIQRLAEVTNSAKGEQDG
ncbi:MAG: hypothetical protein QW628_09020, partial [Thermofilum sp.]